MNCKKCGAEIQEDWNACPICLMSCKDHCYEGEAEIPSVKNDRENETGKSDGKQGISYRNRNVKIYIIIFLACLALSIIDWPLRVFAFFAALVTIVTAFIKCPGSRAIKVLFWLFVGLIVCYAAVLLILAHMCASVLSSLFSGLKCG